MQGQPREGLAGGPGSVGQDLGRVWWVASLPPAMGLEPDDH